MARSGNAPDQARHLRMFFMTRRLIRAMNLPRFATAPLEAAAVVMRSPCGPPAPTAVESSPAGTGSGSAQSVSSGFTRCSVLTNVYLVSSTCRHLRAHARLPSQLSMPE